MICYPVSGIDRRAVDSVPHYWSRRSQLIRSQQVTRSSLEKHGPSQFAFGFKSMLPPDEKYLNTFDWSVFDPWSVPPNYPGPCTQPRQWRNLARNVASDRDETDVREVNSQEY